MDYIEPKGVFVPRPKGRKPGSRNRNAKQRDEAIAIAKEYHAKGMSKIEAANATAQNMNLPMTKETLARLI